MAAFMSNFIEAGPGANEGKKALYHCNYCNKDISGKIRIKCTKCPDFDLCVECFSVGAEVTPHKSNHPYRVMVGTNTTISSLTCSWSLIWYKNFYSLNVESFMFLRLQVGCIFSFFNKKLVCFTSRCVLLSGLPGSWVNYVEWGFILPSSYIWTDRYWIWYVPTLTVRGQTVIIKNTPYVSILLSGSVSFYEEEWNGT